MSPSTSLGRWPAGRNCAAAFTFDVDAESAVLYGAAAVGRRLSAMSHQAYGPLVGVPRILSLLEKHSIKATFFVPGYTAERYPGTVRDIAAAGHEIGHHGYLHEPPAALSKVEESEALDRGLQALERAANTRPTGYRAPMWDLSWHTPALLAERGFLYDSSLMDADSPYELAVDEACQQSLVEIPIQWSLDDWEQYCYLPGLAGTGLIETPEKATTLWRTEFESLREIGGCWVLTNHPFLSGRPSRAAALDRLMSHVSSHDDVWVAPLEDIARHIRNLGLPASRLTPPEQS